MLHKQTLQDHSGGVHHLFAFCLSHGDEFILSGGDNGDVKVWEVSTGELVKTIGGPSGILSICMSSDDESVLTGCYDAIIRVMDFSSGICFKVLKGHSESVHFVSISYNSEFIVSGSNDKTIKMWDFKTCQNSITLQSNQSPSSSSVCISSNDKYIVSGGVDGDIMIWEVSSGGNVKTLNGHTESVQTVCMLSNDESIVVSGSGDNTIKMWDIQTGTCLSTLGGHTDIVHDISISSNNEFIVSGSADNTIKIWMTETGECLNTTTSHSEAVLGARISPRNDFIVLFGRDHNIMIWDVTGVSHVSVTSEPDNRATAVNDNAKGGVDRFGYTYYAKALVDVLRDASPPMCVGLYAKWGSGKSFMIHLLKKEFDSYALEDPLTRNLYQWFEQNEYLELQDKLCKDKLTCKDNSSWMPRLKFRLLIMKDCLCCTNCSRLPDMYGLLTLVSLASDIVKDVVGIFFVKLSPLYYGHDFEHVAEDDIEEGNTINSGYALEEEVVFVDYNAWEFSRSPELWTGIVRNIYEKIEKRIKSQENYAKSPHAKKVLDKFSSVNAGKERCILENRLNKISVDYKERWRIETAKRKLRDEYGESGLVIFVIIGVIFVVGSVALIVLSFTILTSFWKDFRTTASSFVPVLVSLMVVGGTIVPSLRLLKKSFDNANVSQGELFYREGNGTIVDNIGFLSRVKEELSELFHFMSHFTAETGIKLRLVVFVDDLDRCFGEHSVKVLEAIQLVLALSGLPVIVFLAVDSRVVVASVESTINKNLDLRDAMISGFEYMDKIIQLPFCIPDVSSEKLESLLCEYSQPSADALMDDVVARLSSLRAKFGHRNLTGMLSVDFQRNTPGDIASWLDKLLTLIRTVPSSLRNGSVLDKISSLNALGRKLNAKSQRAVTMIENGNPLGREYLYQVIEDYLQDIGKMSIMNNKRFLCSNYLSLMCISSDGNLIVTNGEDSVTIKVWDIASGSCVSTLRGSSAAVATVSMSLEAMYVLSGCADGSLKVWDMATAKCLCTLKGHTGAVKSLSIAPSNQFFVSGGIDSIVKVWKISGECIGTLGDHNDAVLTVCFSPNEKRIISGSRDKTIKIWDVALSMCVLTLDRHVDVINTLCTSSGGDFIASSGTDNTIRVWKLRNCVDGDIHHGSIIDGDTHDGMRDNVSLISHVDELRGHSGAIFSLCISSDDKFLLSGSFDNTIRIWDVETATSVRALQFHSDIMKAVQLSKDNNYIVAGYADGSIYLNFFDKALLHNVLSVVNGNVVENIVGNLNSKQNANDKRESVRADPTSDRGNKRKIDQLKEDGDSVNVRRREYKLLSTSNKSIYDSSQLIVSSAATILPRTLLDPLLTMLQRSDSNPRAIKRILNVVLLLLRFGSLKPVGEEKDPSYDENNKLANHEKWPNFFLKLIKWIVLCECFPYRMSFLVHCIENFEQKAAFNKISRTVKYNEFSPFRAVMDSTLSEFFEKHVKKFLQCIPSCTKFDRSDGGADAFNYALNVSYGDSDSDGMLIHSRDVIGVVHSDDTDDKVSDVDNDSTRSDEFIIDPDFSLLRYTLNLIPSIRKQIGVEMNDFLTGSELCSFENVDDHSDMDSSNKGQVNGVTKQQQLSQNLTSSRVKNVMKLSNDGFIFSRKQYHDYSYFVNNFDSTML